MREIFKFFDKNPIGKLITRVVNDVEVLNEMSTNPTFNVIFFLLLVVFAVSFMGAFEIRLPNSWLNKADSKADKGGMIGIFFMALALAVWVLPTKFMQDLCGMG